MQVLAMSSEVLSRDTLAADAVSKEIATRAKLVRIFMIDSFLD
jgi:hypothetical protein